MESRKYICIFCGSDEKASQKYKDLAIKVADIFIEKDYGLVFGNANVGLMKIVADRFIESGKPVIGVTISDVVAMRVCHPNLTQSFEEPTLETRIHKMKTLSVACVALHGGIGTFHEILTIAASNQYGTLKKTPAEHVWPMVVVNGDHFYDGLQALVKDSRTEGFIKQNDLVYFADNVNAILPYIENFVAPKCTSKWEESTEITNRSIFAPALSPSLTPFEKDKEEKPVFSPP